MQTNATLASLGGGAMCAGGLGMAGGFSILGMAIAGGTSLLSNGTGLSDLSDKEQAIIYKKAFETALTL